MITADKNHRALQCGAVVCLTAYLMSAGLVPELLAMGAWFEGSHKVQLCGAEDRISIVLSHQPGGFGYSPRFQRGSPAHRHGPAARVFCLFSASARATPDHVA